MLNLTRRHFIRFLGGAAAWPLAARAQQAQRTYRIGFLGGAEPNGYAAQLEALRLGLQDHGYVAGKNVHIEYRWAVGRYERLPALAAELVALNVDVIITQGTPAVIAAKQATTTIPIVMALVGSPIESGIATGLSRPGGNVTGSAFFHPELNAKRLEILKSLKPDLVRVGALVHPGNAAMVAVLRGMEETALALDITLQRVELERLENLDAVFARAKTQVEGLIVVDEGVFIANAGRIAQAALNIGLPSLGFRQYCDAGGLAAYGVDYPHIWRRSMALVDKVLKGVRPADLPIEQATRFELVINLKTAKSLDLEIPPMVLARADEVIE